MECEFEVSSLVCMFNWVVWWPFFFQERTRRGTWCVRRAARHCWSSSIPSRATIRASSFCAASNNSSIPLRSPLATKNILLKKTTANEKNIHVFNLFSPSGLRSHEWRSGPRVSPFFTFLKNLSVNIDWFCSIQNFVWFSNLLLLLLRSIYLQKCIVKR